MTMRQLLGVAVCALLGACSVASASDLGPLPSGWFVAGPGNVRGVSSADYSIGVDPAVHYDGNNSAYIGSKGTVGAGTFGTFMQTFSAKQYLGQRVKFSASVRSKDATYVGLWMRIDDSLGAERFDNMQNRKIAGTTDWKTYDVVLDVPENAVSISIGMLDAGNGEAWMSDATFSTADKNTPTTDTIGPAALSAEPQNLKF